MPNLDFTKFSPEQGKLLLSEPFMYDPFFKRTVILLTMHNIKGTIGFIINRPLKMKLGQIIKELSECELPVYFGGPIQNKSLFYIHTLGNVIPDSIPVFNGLFWSGNFETIKDLIKENKITENEICFFIGYSGWFSNQLEDEIKQNSWIVAPASTNVIFGKEREKLWQDVLKSMGNDYSILANFPENPQLN
ncbi:MAG: YqgE/AlgH family protein [Bacteroidota bacterium]